MRQPGTAGAADQESDRLDQRAAGGAAASGVAGAPVPAGADDAPVTVVVSRVVRPGAEAAFEEWLAGVCREASRFEGHLGVNVIRPTDKRRPEYVLIFRFDRYENLKRWNESPVRDAWLERALPLTLEPPRMQVVTGLEYWFTPPEAPFTPPPPRRKMVIVTWLAIFPISTLIAAVQPFVAGVPLLLRTLATSGVLVLLMTYVVMPRMTRLFARWLFASSPKTGVAAPKSPGSPGS